MAAPRCCHRETPGPSLVRGFLRWLVRAVVEALARARCRCSVGYGEVSLQRCRLAPEGSAHAVVGAHTPLGIVGFTLGAWRGAAGALSLRVDAGVAFDAVRCVACGAVCCGAVCCGAGVNALGCRREGLRLPA